MNIIFSHIQPLALHALRFRDAKARKQERKNDSQGDRMLSVPIRVAHRFAERLDFVGAETAFLLLARQDANAQRGIGLDYAEPLGMSENAAKRGNGAAGNTRSAGCRAATTIFARLGRFSRRDIGLYFFNVGQLQRPDLAGTKQWLDVSFNSAP